MKKRIFSWLLLCAILAGMVPAVLAVKGPAEEAAQSLYEMGLFRGTGTEADGSPRFDLDRTLTRHEAAVMLVRLLGREQDAAAGSWEIPFSDVAEWARPYVGYAYANGLTTGTSESAYGGGQAVTASQYLTFLLRALGYESGTDFSWDRAWELSDTIGLTAGGYSAATTSFTRADAAAVSAAALRTAKKGTKKTLLDTLVTAGAVDKTAAERFLHPVESVVLNKSACTVFTGKTERLLANVRPADAADKTVSWSSSNPAVATVSGGSVQGIAPGTAVITAAAANGKTASCTVTVEPAPISYSGTGDCVITGITIPAGTYYAEYTHNGKRNFISKFYYGSKQSDYFRISNKIGVCSGQVALYENSNHKITNGVLEVQADGDWTIEFKPVSGKTTTNISGNGEIVTGLFTATASRNVIRTTHQGDRNFIVKVIKYNGTRQYDYETVTNKIGNYSGQTVVDLVAGQKYYVYVQADGAWTIDFGRGEAQTVYTPPEIPEEDGGAGGYTPEAPGGGSGKYTQSDARQLSSYAASASELLNKAAKDCVSAGKGLDAQRKMYLNSAAARGETVRKYLENALEILENRNTLRFTDGTTLQDTVREAYDRLGDLEQVSIDGENLSGAQDELYGIISDAQVKVLKFQNAAAQLLAEFD